MKRRFSALAMAVLLVVLASCGPRSRQTAIAKALEIDLANGDEISVYDTHSGNGDGVSHIAFHFRDHRVLEQIRENPRWKALPLDETVTALVYGRSDATASVGPFLTDDRGNALVPEIQHGYYILIDEQAETGVAAGADILHRASFNFMVGLYDTDTDILHFCRMDT